MIQFFKKNKTKIHDVFAYVAQTLLYICISLIVVIGLLFCAYLVDSSKVAKSGKHKSPLFNSYLIVSESMVPTIKVQDGVIIKRSSKIKKGSIITFAAKYANKDITHRVVSVGHDKKGNEFYITKGDNNSSIDHSVVYRKDVYGKVLFIIPKLGYMRQYVMNPVTWCLMGSLLLILILIFYLYKLLYKQEEYSTSSNGLSN